MSAKLSDPTELSAGEATPPTRSRFRRTNLIIGSVILGVWILLAILAPVITAHDPYEQDLGSRLLKPFWETKSSSAHLFGTDGFGRDYLSRILHGSRISLIIGISAALIAGVIGTSLGLIAGYVGGRVDTFILFLITVRLAMPVILIALSLVFLVGNSLVVIILVLGLLMWDRFAVVARTATLQAASLDYVRASELLSSPRPWIALRVILPNIASPVIVVLTLEIAHAMLLEAALSFLGIGVAPPTPSLGMMISEARPYLFFDFWMIALPGAALFSIVLAVNLFGDGLRDVAALRRR
jgi:peptide/nickel transport system permease protein